MAYVYDKIENQLQAGDQVGADQLKTEISAGGQRREVSQNPDNSGRTNQTDNANVRAFQSAKERVKTPDVFKDLSSQIGQRQQDLQREANQYTDQARQRDFSVSQANIERAINKDEQERNTIASRLSGQQAPRAERFQTGVQNVRDEYLATPEGIGEYYRDISGPRYSAGEQTFDVMLANRSPETQLARQRALREQQAFGDQLRNIGDVQTQTAQDIYNQNYGAANEAIRSYLTSEGQGVLADRAAREADMEAARREQLANKENFLATRSNQALRPLQQSLRDIYTDDYQQRRLNESLAMLESAGIDPTPYLNMGAVDIDPSNITSVSEADRFNSIMSLLGQEDNLIAATQPIKDILQFDQGGYGEAAYDAFRRAREKEDLRLAEEQAGIFSAADERARGINTERNKLEFQNKFKQDLMADIMSQLGYTSDDITAPDISPYVQFGTSELTGRDVLTPEEVAQLNDIRGSLGSMEPAYQVGDNRYDDFAFQEDAYKNALIELYKNRNLAPTGTVPLDFSQPEPIDAGFMPIAGWFPDNVNQDVGIVPDSNPYNIDIGYAPQAPIEISQNSTGGPGAGMVPDTTQGAGTPPTNNPLISDFITKIFGV